MAVTAYARLRMLWGALDWQQGTDNPYTTAQTQSGGSSAAAGSGVGVRRAVCHVDRKTLDSTADDALVHFDFLNMTSGSVDDTWITSDYTTLEGYLNTFFGHVKSYWPSGYKLTQYSWYRVGSGVTSPNPAERTLVLTTPISGTGADTKLPPQCASSITFRTAVRKSWGRTYLPMVYNTAMTSTQRLSSGDVDGLAGWANDLVNSAAGSDFHLVVVSKHLSASLNVEKVEMDDVVDIIRRRRWRSSTYRKILP